jgi:uncharacterized membrane protein
MPLYKTYHEFTAAWYGVLVFFAGMLSIMSMGGGIFGLDGDHYYHKASLMVFDSLCHQQEGRSLSVSGVAMAVCSRCFSIYGSFFAGLLLFPLLFVVGLPYPKKVTIRFISATLSFIVIDFLGNLAGFWMNTHQSRIILGALFGFSLALLLAGEFKLQSKKINNGTN